MKCEHNFIYQGMKYRIDPRPLPGTSAQAVEYFEAYYCSKCLFEELRKVNEISKTYSPILFNATPVRR